MFLDEKYFELSAEQQEYYDKCFLHLLAKTQVFPHLLFLCICQFKGASSLSGALNGSDGRIVEFFRAYFYY